MKRSKILLLLVLALSCTKRKEIYRANEGAPSSELTVQVGGSSLRALQERMEKGDITSTESLVKAFNAAQTPQEQRALQQGIQKYIEWFNGQSVGDLTPAATQEYTCLAHIQATPENRWLLERYFNNLCNKIDKEYQHSEKPLIEALEYTLQNMDSAVFDGNPAPLTHLGDKLLAKLDPGSNEFTKATYPTHRSTLYALHQTLILIQRIAPDKWDPTREEGLYSRFKARIQAISASTKYYPIRYHARLLKQSLQRLEEDQSRLQDRLKRVGHGLEGMIYLYQGVRALADLEVDLEAFKSCYESLQAALDKPHIDKRPWYDSHQLMNYASLLSLKDPTQYGEFEDRLQTFQSKEAGMREKDRTALRFGIVQQLRVLALGGLTQQVRKQSIQWLKELAQPEEWGGDPAVMEGLLDGLASIAVHSQGAEKEQAKEALDSLTHKPELRRRDKYVPWRTARFAAQSAITQWLGNCPTIDDKLSTLPAPAAAPDSSESLFLAIKSLLREEAPKEDELRRQLTLKVNTLLPPPAVTFFVGRAQELKAFRQSFQAQQERLIAPPITGPGGVGKTQLALRVVKQQVEETPYDYVFWIPAESEEKLLEAY
ncbi:MAG: hypothetical protein MJA30_16105, partial [Cytophagales bacterium]|nr:hypothetical protein [Cytophagales bacterium]